MNDINLDLVLNDIQSKLSSPKNSKIEESDIKVENESDKEQIDLSNSNSDEDLEIDEKSTSVKDEKVEETKKESVTIDKELESLKKELVSKDKALNDTKRSYQNSNQKLVLSKKKYNSVIEEIKNTLFSSENSLLDDEEYNTLFNKLNSVFDFKDEELEVKEEISKDDNKSKSILEKLEKEFDNFKKYNKSKGLDENYKAFFDSVHLLNVEERQNLLDYLEDADPTDSIEKLLQMGQDYRNLFEKGLKKHNNVFKYVGSLHEEITKLHEEINKLKENVDNDYDISENKQIKSRSSVITNSKKYDDHTRSLIDMLQ